LLLFGLNLQAQNRVSETTLPQKLEFTFNEYLGYVKKFHPLVKTANLEINKAGEFNGCRGARSKIEVDFDKSNSRTPNIIRF
jgi:hypothetical protein